MLRLLLSVSIMVGLCACQEPRPTVTFVESNECQVTQTGARRIREEQSTCRRYAQRPDGSRGSCVSYNYRTVHERQERVQCSKFRWLSN